MRHGWLLAIVSLLLLGAGAQLAVMGLGARQPQTLTCTEFYARRPSAQWVRLTGCRVRFFDASYRERSGVVQEVYAPIVPVREEETVSIELVLATRDSDAVTLMREMEANEKQSDRGPGLAFLAKNAGRLVASRDIVGLVRLKFDRSAEPFRKLKEIESNLAEGFAVLEEGRRPSAILSIATVAGSIVALLVAVALGVAAAVSFKRVAGARSRPPSDSSRVL